MHYLLGGISYYDAQNRNSSDKYRESERYLNQALNMNPSFSMASLLLAKVCLALGDKQKARANAENAIRNTKEQEVLNEAQSILQMN